jgi:outer membrane protein TolC
LAETIYDADTGTYTTIEVPTSDLTQDRATVGATKLLRSGTELSLSTAATRRDSNSTTVVGSQVLSATDRYDTSLTARVVQPLLQGAWSGINLARLRQAQSVLAEEQLRSRAQAADVTLAAQQAYWTLSHAYARRDLLGSSVEAAQQLVDEMQARADRGLATPIDLLQAQAELAQRKEDLIQAEVAIGTAGDELAEAMGGLLDQGGVGYTPVVAELPRGEVPLAAFQGVWPRVLEEDFDARIQQEAIARNDLDRIIAEDMHKPRLDAYAQGSLLGVDESGPGRAYGDAARREGHSWSAGVEFSVPWGRREGLARSRQADLIVEQAKIRLIQIKQDLYKRARLAWRTVNAGNERLKAARARLEFEDGAYDQARARYDRGLTSFRELLEARRDLDSARSVYIDVLRDLAIARGALARMDGSLFEQIDFSHNPAPATDAPQE